MTKDIEMLKEQYKRKIKTAYKKLKANAYYDKHLVKLKHRIALFEDSKDVNVINEKLENIIDKLFDDDGWMDYKTNSLKSIMLQLYPKKLKSNQEDNFTFITNLSDKDLIIEEYQVFIDMDIEIQILGILWILTIGVDVDSSLYEHSYGNRLKKFNRSNTTNSSPNLFEPYFTQYENWRNSAIRLAEEEIQNDRDIIILSLDIKKFYYSVNFSKEVQDKFKYDFCLKEDTYEETITSRLCDLVFSVLEEFSVRVSTYNFPDIDKGRVILPLSFFPSGILANWYLNGFDDKVVERWNPLYYGRYVDDIIIVDRVLKNSEIWKNANNNELSSEKIIKYYLQDCNANKDSICNADRSLLFTRNLPNEITEYTINNQAFDWYKSELDKDERYNLVIQNKKVKAFYLNSNNSNTVIKSFKRELIKNKSGFKLMPEEEHFMVFDDYSEIYKMGRDGSINQFSGINSVEIDKFELSKFLGRYSVIGNLISDKKHSLFCKELNKIFNSSAIVENYMFWERIIEILVINENFEYVQKFTNSITTAIDDLNLNPELALEDEVEDSKSLNLVKYTLYSNLVIILIKSFSLVWGGESDERLERILRSKVDYLVTDINIFNDDERLYYKYINTKKSYVYSRMISESALPIMVECIIKYLLDYEENSKKHFNLTNFDHWIQRDYGEIIDIFGTETSNTKENRYSYYPYVINPQDIQIALAYTDMIRSKCKEREYDKKNYYERLNKVDRMYHEYNYGNKREDSKLSGPIISVKRIKDSEEKHYVIDTGTNKMSKAKIGIANLKLCSKGIENVLIDRKNRSYERYSRVSKIINESIKQKVDILILPEASVPFEWLSQIVKVANKNNMAIVMGVEHIAVDDNVFNQVVTILPYVYAYKVKLGITGEDDYEALRLSNIIFHKKVHFAPSEIELINGYDKNPVEGEYYELYNWNDIWFSNYCCFELTSIKDRSIFLSYLDILIAVEFNKDVNYYSNIMESLDRDMHCYCVQVNDSQYGDSRIVRPTSTVRKNIVRTKGGINPTVLVGEVDVAALRKFQLKNSVFQLKDKSFKPTPPQFNRDIVKDKIDQKLRSRLVEIDEKGDEKDN